MEKNVIIIGSGPAGYTAALYAARAGLKPLMLTGQKVGGQLTDTGDVENFPGYRESITGIKMMEDFRFQAEKFGTEIIQTYVKKVDFSKPPYIITDYNNEVYKANSIIISTGANAKWLGLESENNFNGMGVSGCATCDGFFYKNQDVLVIGGGDTACEEALYLSNICNSVKMLVRKNQMKASQIMQDRVYENKKITVEYNTSVKEILGDSNGVHSIETNSDKIIECTGIFIAIGHIPNTSLFEKYIELDDDGYIITRPKSTETNIEGIFACGDVQDKKYRQAITAAGTGCMAALDVEKYLMKNK